MDKKLLIFFIQTHSTVVTVVTTDLYICMQDKKYKQAPLDKYGYNLSINFGQVVGIVFGAR